MPSISHVKLDYHVFNDARGKWFGLVCDVRGKKRGRRNYELQATNEVTAKAELKRIYEANPEFDHTPPRD